MLVLLVLVAGPLAVTAAYFLFSDQTVPPIDLLLAGALLIATLESTRFLPYFVVAWCGVAARCPPIPSERLRGTIATWPLVLCDQASPLLVYLARDPAWIAVGRGGRASVFASHTTVASQQLEQAPPLHAASSSAPPPRTPLLASRPALIARSASYFRLPTFSPRRSLRSSRIRTGSTRKTNGSTTSAAP